MRPRAAVAALAITAGLVVVPTSAQAATGCVTSGEWGQVYKGQSIATAERIMGATGDTIQTMKDPDGTIRVLKRYRWCSTSDIHAYLTIRSTKIIDKRLV